MFTEITIYWCDESSLIMPELKSSHALNNFARILWPKNYEPYMNWKLICMPFGSYHLTTFKKKSRTSKTNRRMPVPLLPQQYLIYPNLIQFIKDQKGDPKWNVEKETLTYQGSLETNQPIRVLQSLHYYNYYPGVHSKQEAQQWRVYPPWTLVEKRTTST